jgi:putative ABC transport system substrate-binding protein
MIARRALVAALLAAPLSARAQGRRYRIGWLVFGGATLGPIDRTLRSALAQQGWVEGGNLDVFFRYANGAPARLGELARELVALKPDLLIGIGGDLVKALFDASSGRIPIVGGVSEDPVRAQFVVSLARPGKSFTGVTFITDELAAKRIELLTEVAPGTKRVAAIWNPQHADNEIAFARRTAEALGITLTSHEIYNSSDIDAALKDATARRADSIFVVPSRLTGLAAARIARYGRDHRLPVVTAWREFVDAGCLLSYGPDRAVQVQRIADYAGKVLRGAKPEELPVERPTKFELVINLDTARAIGLAMPPSLLTRADDVIE